MEDTTSNTASNTNSTAAITTPPSQHHADVLIIGAGIAGICCALEIMDNDSQTGTNTQILMLDRDTADNMGGLARLSFGGIFVCGTPEQAKNHIQDSPELAFKDWLSYGEFGRFGGDTPEQAQTKEKWARQWAQAYVNHCKTDVYDWVKRRGVKFLPMPLWVERGLHGGGDNQPIGGGNSVPRWHIAWGTGKVLTETLIHTLQQHHKRHNLTLIFEQQVTALLQDASGAVIGCLGNHSTDQQHTFQAHAAATVIAAGGINGSMDMVRQYWHPDWQQPPATLLNGSHQYADGTLHQATSNIGGNVTFLHNMWNYAAGIHHWRPKKPNHGLSLVPPKSALWLNATGERIQPPLVTAFDTRDLVTQVCAQPEGYSWQLLNYKIALKEFAISGAEFNEAFRERSYVKMIKQLLFGNKKLVDEAIEHCSDIVTADTLDALVDKMNALPAPNGESSKIELAKVQQAVNEYQAAIDAGEPFSDPQLQRIKHARAYKGDKLRTCKYQKISDPHALPYIAIREFIVSRKSLGGIQTNLQAQVLTTSGEQIAGLYAIGEAAGFGGGGMNGLRGLEGTFLGGCIYSGRLAGQAIANAQQTSAA